MKISLNEIEKIKKGHMNIWVEKKYKSRVYPRDIFPRSYWDVEKKIKDLKNIRHHNIGVFKIVKLLKKELDLNYSMCLIENIIKKQDYVKNLKVPEFTNVGTVPQKIKKAEQFEKNAFPILHLNIDKIPYSAFLSMCYAAGLINQELDLKILNIIDEANSLIKASPYWKMEWPHRYLQRSDYHKVRCVYNGEKVKVVKHSHIQVNFIGYCDIVYENGKKERVKEAELTPDVYVSDVIKEYEKMVDYHNFS